MTNLSKIINDTFHLNRYEPEKRLHDWYGHHGHRFPIKGGISAVEVMSRELMKTNTLIKRLMAKQ